MDMKLFLVVATCIIYYLEAACPQPLANSRRLSWLPNITVRTEPIAMSSNMCGFKATCCDISSFNYVQGTFTRLELLHFRPLEAMFMRFQDEPAQFLSFLIQMMSRNFFSVNRDLKLVYNSLRVPLNELLSRISNQNVMVKFRNFFTVLIGYFSGFMCSLCDPSQLLYTKTENDIITTHISNDICIRLSSKLISFLKLLEDMIIDVQNIAAVNLVVDHLCEFASDPLGIPSQLDRHGKAGCLQIKSDISSLATLLGGNETWLGEFVGCRTISSCSQVLCEDTLQGLAFNLSTISHSINNQLDRYCSEGCDRLKEYVVYFLGDRMNVFTEGPIVRNTFNGSSYRLSLWNIGCGAYLSSFSCTTLPDVTFITHNIKAITVAVVVLCFILGGILFLWCKYKKSKTEPLLQSLIMEQY